MKKNPFSIKAENFITTIFLEDNEIRENEDDDM